MRTLELEVQGDQVIKLGDAEFFVCFPFPILLQLEKKLDRPMRQPIDFLKMTMDEVPAVLEHGLRKRHGAESEDIAGQILHDMSHEDTGRVMDFLCGAAFPRAMERIEEHIKRMGEAPKNVSSVAAS